MKTDKFKSFAFSFLKKGWCTLLLLPFISYSLHQAYWTLRFNIFFSISYDFPFPINIIHIFLDNFLLIIHEAGHTFFGILGWRIFTILGGSILEILLPTIILLFFWFKRKKVGIQLSLYLVGYSILSVAFYIADAGARQLPLIGNLSKQAHDWHNLLLNWNALDQDKTIAICFSIVAIMIYILALTLPFFYKSYRQVDLELNL